jgi:radical SAM protein with 4Fe4S-binding SPASM domain
MIKVNKDIVNFPRVVRIEPASQCNLACFHCPTGTVDMPRGLMKKETFEKILDSIRKNKEFVKVVVLYHGGEPLLNPFFCDFVRKIKDVNASIFVKTVSNGMILTRPLCKNLIKCGIDAIEFSLDGVSPMESQMIRVKSNTEKIVINIKFLIGLIKRLRINKPAIYIATTQFIRKIPASDALPVISVPDWLRQEFKKGVKFKPTYGVKWPHMGDCGKFDAKVLDSNLKESNECDHVLNTITIRHDGNVVPCCYDLTSKLIMGNIYDNRLEEIWNNEKYQALRKFIRNKKYVSICANCAVVKPPKYLIPRWRV